MEKLILVANQIPGVVTFDNYNEVKTALQSYIGAFTDIDYSVEGLDMAVANRDRLKQVRDVVSKKKKELEEAYSAPYAAVEKMLDDLLEIIDSPYKEAKSFVEREEKSQKHQQIIDYAVHQAANLGEVGTKIIESPAFFKKDWLMKKYTPKKYQDEINEIFRQAASDINSIQATGGENSTVLMARYYETLSMDGVKDFLTMLSEEQNTMNPITVPSENNVLGYKILKITATEEQMASVMDQLEILGVDVEEIEDGMPKAMSELTVPSFDSFVAFDIETTGSNGALNGDGEAQITEIGAVRVENGVVVEKFDELANPGRKIVPRISRLTHITDTMVADKPPVNEVIRRFHEFVGDNILVGHNIKNSDLHYIVKAANKAGVHFDVPFLDTYILAKKFKNQMGWEKVKLGYLAGQYGFEHKNAHRAWSDAEVNAQVYYELQKLYQKKE